jgi:hypothetical protein
MSLDGQIEKLSALYDEKSDGELLDLYDQRRWWRMRWRSVRAAHFC